MGRTVCFLRARFRTHEEAVRVMHALTEALGALGELWTRWQDLRHEIDRSCADRRRELAASYRLEGMVPWGTFDEQCAARGHSDPNMNCMAVDLPDIGPEYILWAEESELRLEDAVTPSWDGVAHWLRSKGAIEAGWLPEHEIDPWASIPMEGRGT